MAILGRGSVARHDFGPGEQVQALERRLLCITASD